MKRVLCVLAIAGLALLAGTAAAQESGLIAKGIKAGLGMYKFSGSDNDIEGASPDLKMGVAGGGFLTFALGPNFALQPEVLYVMKGSKYEEDPYKLTFKFSYLDIPVLLKYRFPTAGTTRPNLFAGPVASFKMSADVEEEGPDGTEETDFSDAVKGLDFGLALGGGIDFTAGANLITFDVRYTIGMTDWPDADDDDDDAPTIKNSGWLVMAGFSF